MFLFGEIESSDFEQTVPEFEAEHVFFGTFAKFFEQSQSVADNIVALVDESFVALQVYSVQFQEQSAVFQNFPPEIADKKDAVVCLVEAVFPR